jgi:hypothetical protein
MTPRSIKIKKGYVLISFHFGDLEQFLRLCKKAGLKSPLYSKFPRNLLETIQQRSIDPNAEIRSLCLLPIVNHKGKPEEFVNPYFIKDLRDMT